MYDLFESEFNPSTDEISMGDGAVLLPKFALDYGEQLIQEIKNIVEQSPFRVMTTPGGRPMSIRITNSGEFGWVSDTSGYKYNKIDPITHKSWPKMPSIFKELAQKASACAGYSNFNPDACLINRYTPGARLSLHQDKDEKDTQAPIVSISLGLPATFLFGGSLRKDKTTRYRLEHGDIVVWGGATRKYYHGVLPIEEGYHPRLGRNRINITFRKSQ